MQTPLIESVIDDIYQAAADATHFPKMFEAVCRALGSSHGMIMLIGNNCTVSHIYNHSPELIRLYNTVYLGADPVYLAAAERSAQRVVTTARELIPFREYRRTDFFNDCVRPSDVHDSMAVTLEATSTMNAALGVQRSTNEPLFSRADKELLEYLVPHLRRMVRIRRKFEDQSRLTAMSESTAGRLDFGLVMLDHEGWISFTNGAAETILAAGDGLFSRNRCLAAGTDGDMLSRAIARALAEDGVTPTGSELCIRRGNGKRPYVVQIIPADLTRYGQFALMPAASLRGVIVAITDPDEQAAPPVALLRQMFGLTPTEAAMAVQIGQGKSVQEIAEALRIGTGTARWHLKNVQDKTGARRQSALVSLMARIATKMGREH